LFCIFGRSWVEISVQTPVILIAVSMVFLCSYRQVLIYTVFIVRAYQTSTELLSTWRCAAAFFSASAAALSEEVPTVK
jgi:hypothetical protein